MLNADPSTELTNLRYWVSPRARAFLHSECKTSPRDILPHVINVDAQIRLKYPS